MKKDKTAIYTLITLIGAALLLTAFALSAAFTLTENADIPADDGSIGVSVSDDRFNILVTGSDRTSGLTDVIMLLSLDRKNRRATVLQIPRDTYAAYTDGSYKKLNGAYGALGGSGFCDFMSESLGVSIDRYLMLSPDAFCMAVDAVGGVEITLEKPMYYNDPAQNLYISLGAGKQTLDGKAAEQFIRYRSGYSDGDLGRIDAQKLFMCGLLAAVRKNMNPISLAKLSASLLGKTDTNISLADAAMLSDELLSVSNENITLITAPGKALVAEKSGASYYVLSSKAMSEALSKYFGGAAEGFDKKRVFLNRSYESFVKAYEEYREYKEYSAKNIYDGGIGIDK